MRAGGGKHDVVVLRTTKFMQFQLWLSPLHSVLRFRVANVGRFLNRNVMLFAIATKLRPRIVDIQRQIPTLEFLLFGKPNHRTEWNPTMLPRTFGNDHRIGRDVFRLMQRPLQTLEPFDDPVIDKQLRLGSDLKRFGSGQAACQQRAKKTWNESFYQQSRISSKKRRAVNVFWKMEPEGTGAV
jgi:hypothetical protein